MDISVSFLKKYLELALDSSMNDFDDNHDTWRFGPEVSYQKNRLKLLDRLYMFFLKLTHLNDELHTKKTINEAIDYIYPYINGIEWLYQHLDDDESRKLLVQIQIYRALGARRVKLPLNNSDYWSRLEAIDRLTKGSETIDLGFWGWSVYKMRLDSLGYPIELYLRPPGVLHQLVLQQYRCSLDDRVIEVLEGDVVLDAGGCYGETALYFALKAGGSGQVFTFEFMPANLSIFHKNMALNPHLADRVILIKKPLWEHSGKTLFIEGIGPGARVVQNPHNHEAQKIETVSIDEIVSEKELNRLDFIKMDIEGSELSALKGAEKSIRKFHPKMAISIYHKSEDFWEIPQYIDGLGLGYKFALRHFTIHQEETVLFAF